MPDVSQDETRACRNVVPLGLFFDEIAANIPG